MFWGIFRYEFGYQVRRVWPWLIFVVLLGLSVLLARDNSLADAMYEDFFANAPFAIAKSTVIGGLAWLLMAAVIAGEAGARDASTLMYPLVYTASLTKWHYLGGRFLAALAINALLLLAVQAGIMLGIYTSGVEAKYLAPFRPAAYLTAYAFISLPSAIVATALQFSVAVRSGRAMSSYAGSMFMIFMGFFVASFLFFKRGVGTMLDPIGIRFIVEDIAHEWTTVERNVRLLSLEGMLLQNRLLWLGVAAAAFAVTYWRFQFAHRTETTWFGRSKRRRNAQAPTPAGTDVAASAPLTAPSVTRTFGFAIQARKTLAIALESFRAIAKSWAGLVLLVAIPLLTVAIVIDQMSAIVVPLVPRTARVIGELTGALSNEMSRWVIVPLLIVFYAGELVWRERDAGVGEITDAMPGSEWTQVLGKMLGLGLVLVAFTALQMAAAMLAQSIMGYHEFEIGLYVKVLFGLQLFEYLLFVVLAFVVHVLVNQKYVGHLVAILVYAFIAMLAGMLGIEHNLLVYAAGPAWSYTEMRGFGPSFMPWLWFKLYWAAWAVLLAVAARLLWMRGREGAPSVRIQVARRRFTRTTALVAGAAAILVATLGGFIFYNTNVLNGYGSSSAIVERRAEYERRYRRYETTPQPVLTGTNLRIDIHPQRRAVEIRGSYRLVNGSAQPIDSIHVATATSGVETRAVAFDRSAALAVDDKEHGYRIYDLAQPLQPGDTLRLDFEVKVERRGFSNRGIDPSLAPNGSYFTNAAWFPMVGYQRQREIISAADRREHGLAPRPVVASLYDDEGREPAARGGGIAFEAVMSTDDGEVAVAPGELRRTWTEGGRRYFHYSTDAPIGSEWPFFSANYAVHEEKWNDVAIRIYHHPSHTAHLQRMMQGARASLDYYSKEFGPYQYGNLSFVEQPAGSGTGMHAEASMISYGQGIAFWVPKDTTGLDFPYAVMGHEMGHEWGLPYAFVEGAPFLSEGLAWYSSMQLVKASRGAEQLRQLMSFMREPYPHRPIRRGEPLLRALDPYLSYRRGPFAMYALSEYIGSDRVNGAIKTLIEKHASPTSPLVTTLDLYRELQAVTPDSLKYLLHDLFEVNAYWQFTAKSVQADSTAEGAWRVTMEVEAHKMVYDSSGKVSELPMDEWIETGVFADGGTGGELSAPIYVQKHRIRSGKQTIVVTVNRKPTLAGIDPFHLLDWVEDGDDDNIEAVKIGK